MQQLNGEVVLVRLLKAFQREVGLRKGETAHSCAVKLAYDRFLCVGNALVNLYVRCGHLESARTVFDEIPQRDVLTWTSLIAAYARQGDHFSCCISLSFFRQMLPSGILPNSFTFASVKACGRLRDTVTGRCVHASVIVSGCVIDTVLSNSILAMYANHGCFDEARKVFVGMPQQDIASWNGMIGAYVSNGDMEGALELFHRMPFHDIILWNTIISGYMHCGDDKNARWVLYDMARVGLTFCEFTFCLALVLAAKLMLLDLGKQIHSQLVRIFGFGYDTRLGSSLIDMYCKCGELDIALLIIKMNHGAVSWSSLISGYARDGRSDNAIKLFRQLRSESVPVDEFTYAAIARACAESGILEHSKQIHAQVMKSGNNSDSFIASSMVDMYAKCGSIHDALLLFSSIKDHSVVSWTSIVIGCAFHGLAREAVHFFERMLEEGVRPNGISFLGVLSACSHAGLLAEGCYFFKQMQVDHGILPSIEHFTCMVDLLGRVGHLEEAEQNGIDKIGVIWKSLLSACRNHNNVHVGQRTIERLFELETRDDGYYVLSSNMWSALSKWETAADVRQLMQTKQVRKNPGCSWIVLKDKPHAFSMSDRTHQKNE